MNISANASLWQKAPLDTEYFQARAGNSSEWQSFDWASSSTGWVNLSTTNQTIIRTLNYSDSNDEAEVDIRIRVPASELPAAKASTIYIGWAESPT